jgi:hypothetical protein
VHARTHPRRRSRPRNGRALTRRVFLPTAWRGAALACIRRPRDICSSAPSGQRMSQRAAPANNPSAMHYLWLLIGLHSNYRAANRWVVRGSRLFSRVSAGLMMRRKLRGWRDTRQSGSPPGLGRATPRCSPGGRERITIHRPLKSCLRSVPRLASNRRTDRLTQKAHARSRTTGWYFNGRDAGTGRGREWSCRF